MSDWYERYSDKGAICPYCKHLNDPNYDNYELYDVETCEWTCASCEKEFNVEVSVSYRWQTEKVEG